MVHGLAEELLALLSPAAGLPVDELAARLEASVAAAHQRWPDAPPPDRDLVGYVVERARQQPDLAAALPRLRLDDLLLAWWTSRGDSRAIAAFEATHAEAVRRLLHRFHRLDPDELRQLLRIKLFLGSATAPPRILEFSGFGSLANWFKVVAARTFLDAARAYNRDHPAALPDEALLEVAGGAGHPGDAAARQQVVDAIKRALEAAIAALPPRERTFLRHVTVDGLTSEQIAATYELHRVTVARALAAARKRLHDATRALVIAELGVSATGLASALELLDSQLDLSLQRLFPAPTLTR